MEGESLPYLLDTNFFIGAHRTHYPMDVFPGFWNQIIQLATAGRLRSIDKVEGEIRRNEDELTQWIDTYLPANFFLPSNTIIPQYRQVVNWADSRRSHYRPSAISTFLEITEADAWLVAYSLSSGCVLVTEETSNPEMIRAIKIPEPCTHFGLRFINRISLFRALGVRI